jgi:hypothetical protein
MTLPIKAVIYSRVVSMNSPIKISEIGALLK